MANAIRFLSIDAVQAAKSGHPGLPMGAADIVTVLFSKFMEFDAKNPDWPDRDRKVQTATTFCIIFRKRFLAICVNLIL